MCTGPCSAHCFDPLQAQCAIIQRSALCELAPSSYAVGKNNTAAILAPVGRGAGSHWSQSVVETEGWQLH